MASAGSDHGGRSVHPLPSLLGELLLREMGWGVRNLGVNLPLGFTGQCDLSCRARLIFLSISFVADEDAFVREYRSFHKSAAELGTAVIVGGQASPPSSVPVWFMPAFGDRMAHLEEFARRLTSSPLSLPADLEKAERDE